MARSRKKVLRKNPLGLAILLVGTVASLAGGAWWFLRKRGASASGERQIGVDARSALTDIRARSGAALFKEVRGGGGTLAALKGNTERAEKARARRDRILAERAGGAEVVEDEGTLDLQGQRLDTTPPVG